MYAYTLTGMIAAALVQTLRTDTGLSVRALAEAAGIASSTVHRIEKGTLQPTMDMLQRIAEAAGARLLVEPQVDYAASIVGLAQSIRQDIAAHEQSWPVRKAAELTERFGRADAETRRRMTAAEPPSTGDAHWDAFVAGLAEWLTVRVGIPTPPWTHKASRYLEAGWWVTPMKAMHAWEYAGSPASFKTRGVYLHRESLTNV